MSGRVARPPRRGAPSSARRAALALPVALGALGALAAAPVAGAQATPRDTVRRDTLPRSPRDTARAPVPAPGQGRVTPGLDTLRADSPARDGRRSAADSAARDSLVARQLRARAQADTAPVLVAFIDRLRLSSVGGAVGAAWPVRVEGTRLYAVQADYGEVFTGVRLVFGVAYWSSRYTEAARRELEREVGKVVVPTGGALVRVPEIRASDLAFTAEGRWRPAILSATRGPAGRVRPFLSGGLGLHFPNAQGAPISGTFVEQSLDGIALGITGGAGLDLHVLPNFLLTMHARYDLYNGAHHPSLRAGLSYVLDPSSFRLPPRARRRAATAAPARRDGNAESAR